MATNEIDLDALESRPHGGGYAPAPLNVGEMEALIARVRRAEAPVQPSRLDPLHLQLRAALQEHHQWMGQPDIKLVLEEDGVEGSPWKLDNALEYADSSMCERTEAALREAAAPLRTLAEAVADALFTHASVDVVDRVEEVLRTGRPDDARHTGPSAALRDAVARELLGESADGDRSEAALVMAWALTLGGWGVFKRRVIAGGSRPEGWAWHRVNGLGEEIPGAVVLIGSWHFAPPVPGVVREEYAAAHSRLPVRTPVTTLALPDHQLVPVTRLVTVAEAAARRKGVTLDDVRNAVRLGSDALQRTGIGPALEVLGALLDLVDAVRDEMDQRPSRPKT